MLKGFNETYLSICYVPNSDLLVSSTNKSQIRIWDIKKAKTFKLLLENIFSPFNELAFQQEKLIGFDHQGHRVQVFKVNLNDPKDLAVEHFVKIQGGMRIVVRVQKLNESSVAMLVKRGEYHSTTMKFVSCVEIIDINNSQLMHTLTLNKITQYFQDEYFLTSD